MKKTKWIALLLAIVLSIMPGCGKKKVKIVIYTAANTMRIEDMTKHLSEKFPDYEFVVEYISTSKLAARLMAEGSSSDCDIIHDLSYTYLDQLEAAGILAQLEGVDYSQFTDDTVRSDHYVIDCRSAGAIVVNTEMLNKLGLEEPASYDDLLKPEYKGLVVMADPKSSGTGYMFLKSLVNARGEEAAFDYFEQLSGNILQFYSSGNGILNALVQEEAAVALALTNYAALCITDGDPLKILFFEEGSPYTLYGQAIVNGKENRQCVKDVYNYMIGEYLEYNTATYNQEKIYKDKDFTPENYPQNIIYSDMSNDTLEEQERLLNKWVAPAE